MKSNKTRIIIVGGGTAGITVAARMIKKLPQANITVIEPSDTHYYQPLWTLVGAGVVSRESTARPQASVIPRNVTWIQEKVVEFLPDEKSIRTSDHGLHRYDYLVVATGIQLDWHKIPGLTESLGHNGVCSNYSFDSVNSTWNTLKNFQGGVAIFTSPNTLIKCGGAPQKIMYLVEHFLRKKKLRDKSRVVFATPAGKIFGIEKYRTALEKIVSERKIETMFHHNLIEVRGQKKEAVFQNTESGEITVNHYDMLHVTPPMSSPRVVRMSSLADNNGWVEVDAETLQHVRFPEVFSLGDVSSLPTSKTGAAIRKQAPVLVNNLVSLIQGKPMTARYHGYTSCPIVTGYGQLILAEFDYQDNPTETFPFDQSRPRWSMYLLKRFLLPIIYWKGMLKGRM